MTATCLACTTQENLINPGENQWHILSYMLHPYIENYPDLQKHSMARICVNCDASLECIDKFRRCALQNFLTLMSLWKKLQESASQGYLSQSDEVIIKSEDSENNFCDVSGYKEGATDSMSYISFLNTVKAEDEGITINKEIKKENDLNVIQTLVENVGTLTNYNKRNTNTDTSVKVYTHSKSDSFVCNTNSDNIMTQNYMRMTQNDMKISQIYKKMTQNDVEMEQNDKKMTQNSMKMTQNHVEMEQNDKRMTQNSMKMTQNGMQIRHNDVEMRNNKEIIMHENLPREKCVECDKLFKNKYTLRVHNNAYHRGETVYCHECQKWFRTGAYKLHLKASKRHNKEKALKSKPQECLECKKSVLNLKQHMNLHTKGVYCVPCEKWYHKYSYKHHLQTNKKHVDRDDYKYICDECGNKYPTKSEIARHIFSIHFNYRTFKCSKCPKAFTKANLLRNHILVKHEKKLPPRKYICDVCGAGFMTSTIMNKHMVTHTGARPYKCDVCGDTFGFSAALYTHTKLKHKDKKPSKISNNINT